MSNEKRLPSGSGFVIGAIAGLLLWVVVAAVFIIAKYMGAA